LIAFVSLSSFTTQNDNSVILENQDSGTINCKWRDGIRGSNGTMYWSEWTSGECNVTDSGKLIPIR
jgi:hypothetical protein